MPPSQAPALSPPALPSLPCLLFLWLEGCFGRAALAGAEGSDADPILPVFSHSFLPWGGENQQKGRFSAPCSEPEAGSGGATPSHPPLLSTEHSPAWVRQDPTNWHSAASCVQCWSQRELRPLLGGKGLCRVRHPRHQKGMMASSHRLVLRCLL